MARMTHQVVLSKLETTYSTDSTPLAATAADVVLFRNCKFSGIEADQAARPRVQPWHGNRGRPGLFKRAETLSGDVPFCGSGAAGTAPAWDDLLRMCGMAAVITTSTKVDYTPISVGQESGAMYWLMDGTRHRMLGTRGTFGLNIIAGDEATFDLSFTGLYTDPNALALPAATYSGWRDALVPRATITTLSIGGQAYPMRSFKYTHGNQMLVRDIPGKAEVRIVDRAPNLEVVIEAPDGLSPANFFNLATSEGEASVVCTHGTAAGDIVEVRCDQARFLPGIGYDRDGDVALLTLPMMPRPSVGNDEVKITAR